MSAAPATRIAGRDVSRVALGGAGYSIRAPLPPSAQASIRAGFEAGITHFDSARAYATVEDPLHNERLFVRALAGEDVLIATKGGHFRMDRTRWGIDASPSALRRHCDDSLTGLGTEQIGLYYLHHPDPAVPLEDSIGTLAELQEEGKIAAIGVCNMDRGQVERALAVTPIAAVQNRFSPCNAGDRQVLDLCEERGVAHLAYSPLGGSASRGVLRDALPETVMIAARIEQSFERVLLAWLLSLSPAMSVITGAQRTVTIADSAGATDLVLSRADLAIIASEMTAIR